MSRYLLLLPLLLLAPVLAAEAGDWPREIETEKHTITIYQPQPEDLAGATLKGRAAVMVEAKAGGEPIFGAVWFEAVLSIDRDEGTATLASLKVPKVHMSEATDGQEKALATLIEKEVPQWKMEVSMEALQASLDLTEKQSKDAAKFKADPPKIIFSHVPAVLVLIDGKPELRDVPGAKIKYVINSAFPIFEDGGSFFLQGGETWFSTRNLTGEWITTKDVPQVVRDTAAQAAARAPKEDKKPEEPEDKRIPRIIVSTEPAELFFVDGEPKFEAVVADELECISNTESDIFRVKDAGEFYIVLSGRWFKSAKLEGPWTWVDNRELPSTFADIPDTHEKAHVLAHVPGTPQAEDAVADAYIPQTTAIKRDAKAAEVTYDGEPKFESVPGANLDYAVNTDKAVFRIKGKYYLCDQAVWYEAPGPKGPWKVTDHVPVEVQDLPPENPHYSTKYVYVYESTPEVVYCGYTPCYIGACIWFGCLWWGTGWHYHPWIGGLYFGRPCTFGFHVCFNPWTGGWGFGMSWGVGFMHFSVGFGAGFAHCGWFGPCGYRGFRDVDINVNRTNNINIDRTRNNLYNRTGNSTRNADSSTVKRNSGKLKEARNTRGRADDIHADKDGNAWRKDDKGNWQKREGKDWKNHEPPKDISRPATKPARTSGGDKAAAAAKARDVQPAKGLDRDNAARARSSSKASEARQQRSAPAAKPAPRPAAQPRPSAGTGRAPVSRGGGGGRRR